MTLLGIGAMASPRYRPAGILVEYRDARVMIDGGPGAAPRGKLDDWLVSDERSELMASIRRLARRHGVEPAVRRFERGALSITPRRVVHTSHPAFGYVIRTSRRTVVWAPEFHRFPRWARGADLMFAEAAGWSRPIRFAGGVGGHAAALDVAARARRLQVKRLVFAHVGRPTIRALERGEAFPFGELGRERQVYLGSSEQATPPSADGPRRTPARSRGWRDSAAPKRRVAGAPPPVR
jgi:hypothetical protein